MRTICCLLFIFFNCFSTVYGEDKCSSGIEVAFANYDEGEFPLALEQLKNLEITCQEKDTLTILKIKFKIISCLFNMGDWKSAEEILIDVQKYNRTSQQKLNQINYNNLMLYFNARLLKIKGQAKEALTLIEQCIKEQKSRGCDEDLLLMQAQNQKGNILLVFNELEAAKNEYKKARRTCREDYGQTFLHKNIDAIVLGNLGVCFHYENSFDSAAYYYERSIKAFEQLGNSASEDIARTNYNMALILESKGYLDRALEMYEYTLSYYKNKYGNQHKEIAKCYGAIGYLHHLRGDDAKALIYFLKDVKISESIYGAEHHFVAEALLNVALSHYQLNDLDLAESTLNRIISILQTQFGVWHLDLSEAYNRMALVRHGKGDIHDAIDYLEQSIAIQERLRGHSSVDYIQINTRLANYLSQISSVDSALTVLKKAKRSLHITFEDRNFEFVNVYINLAHVYCQMNELALAANYLDSSRQIVFASDEINLDNEQLTSFEKSFPNLAFNYLHLHLKYAIKIKESHGEANNLNNEVHDVIERGVALSQYVINQYNSEQNAVAFLNKYREFMDDAVYYLSMLYEQSKQKDDLMKTFVYTELAKGIISRTYVEQKRKNREYENVSILRNRLRYLYSDLEYSLHNGDASEEIAKIRSKLEATQDELEIQQTNNLYFHTDIVKSTEQMSDAIQQLLDLESTSIVSYYWDKSRTLLYNFIVNNGEVKLKVDLIKNLEEKVFDLKTSLVNFSSELHSNSIIAELYSDLHLKEVQNQKANLIVIPDGILSSMPFEILSDNGKMLINEYSIVYASSADLFFSIRKKTKTKKKVLAFAPTFGGTNHYAEKQRHNFAPLHGALLEVNGIKRITPTELVTGEKATEEAFKKNAPNFKFIHIASHAYENNRFPMQSYLKFSTNHETVEDGFLYLNELFDLSINAELVALSACNTGIGKLVEGEGMLSFARTFKYSGADNVLMSLWKVPDKETAEIMESFYFHLSRSTNAAEALRKAKLDFLDKASPNKLHPFYWAGFILQGSNEKIRMPNKMKTRNNILLTMLGFGLIGFFVTVKRQTRIK